MENGGRKVTGGSWQLPPHTSEKIAAYALLLGEDPAEILAMVGRDYDPSRINIQIEPADPELESRIVALEASMDEVRGEVGALCSAVEKTLEQS